MGWTSKMRANRLSWNFNRDGQYRGNGINSLVKPQIKRNPSTDTENRKEILKEIEKRVLCGEKIDDIIEEIANREETKKQFDYYEKNGIKDLVPIIKNWYESYNKSKGRKNNLTLVD